MEFVWKIVLAMEFVWNIVSTATEFVQDSVSSIQNYETLDEKMVNLKRKMRGLESRARDVRMELDNSWPRRKRRQTVENWLANVEEMKTKLQQLEQNIRNRRFNNYLQLQNALHKCTVEREELHLEGAFPDGLTLTIPGSGQPRGSQLRCAACASTVAVPVQLATFTSSSLAQFVICGYQNIINLFFPAFLRSASQKSSPLSAIG